MSKSIQYREQSLKLTSLKAKADALKEKYLHAKALHDLEQVKQEGTYWSHIFQVRWQILQEREDTAGRDARDLLRLVEAKQAELETLIDAAERDNKYSALRERRPFRVAMQDALNAYTPIAHLSMSISVEYIMTGGTEEDDDRILGAELGWGHPQENVTHPYAELDK